MPNRLDLKSRAGASKKAATKRERGKVVWRVHHRNVGTSQSFRLMRKSGRPFLLSFLSSLRSKGCRPKGTTGTTTRVQTPTCPNATADVETILRRGIFTTMSGATEESVVPAALWSRVDAAPKVRTMMVDVRFGDDDDDDDGFHVRRRRPFGMGDTSFFLLSLSLSLSRRKRKRTNEETCRRHSLTRVLFSSSSSSHSSMVCCLPPLLVSSFA